MSYLSEKTTIESYFADNWNKAKIVYENDIVDIKDSEWVRLSILNGKAQQVTLGCTNYDRRNYGVLVLQVFVKINTGSGRALELADSIADLFENKRVSNIQFKMPQVSKVPMDEDSYWYQVNVSIDFYRG